MTDRPILFSAPMIRALLDGKKSQTRQVLKKNGRPPEFFGPAACKTAPELWGWENADGEQIGIVPSSDRAYDDFWQGGFRVGQRLWVRETFFPRPGVGPVARPHYRADPESDRPEWRGLWKPSIHMPRWASRITLIVTDVRVQRLQDISEEDAIAEGLRVSPGAAIDLATGDGVPGYSIDLPNGRTISSAGFGARRVFADLWDAINGPGAWDANPWVVALTFTAHRRNIDQMEVAA